MNEHLQKPSSRRKRSTEDIGDCASPAKLKKLSPGKMSATNDQNEQLPINPIEHENESLSSLTVKDLDNILTINFAHMKMEMLKCIEEKLQFRVKDIMKDDMKSHSDRISKQEVVSSNLENRIEALENENLERVFRRCM